MAKIVTKFRFLIFLKDVLSLAFTAFGGPQAHLSMMFELMVKKRAYVTESELIELNALCQILPGPTSTQTIVAIGFKKGGFLLAILSLLVWVLPAGIAMILLGFYVKTFRIESFDLRFTRFIQPMAISFILYASYKIGLKTLHSFFSKAIFVLSLVLSFVLSYFIEDKFISALLFPFILLLSGFISSFKNKRSFVKVHETFPPFKWRYLYIFIIVFFLSVLLGNSFHYRPILMFENFYRNGSLIFGGGQILIPLLKAEYVDFKKFLTTEEFLSGLGFVQAMPGPVFSISGYIGALSMPNSDLLSCFIGGMSALMGVFLPGSLLIFFVYQFWESLKKYNWIKNSLEGITAAGVGMVCAAAILLMFSVELSIYEKNGLINIGIMIGTFLALLSEKVPSTLLIVLGLLVGFFI